MVDINLFKEEGEEEEWKPEGEGENLEDEFGEDFDLGEEESESSPLDEDDENLLGDEEAIPDFEEPDDKEVEEDYEYGEGKEKKTPIWLWAALGIVLIGASIYLFWYQPRQRRAKGTEQPVASLTAADSLRQSSQQSQPGVGVVERDSTSTVRDTTSRVDLPSGQPTTPSGLVSTTGMRRKTPMVQATTAVFENLSDQGQRGTIILEGDKFHVGYVSAAPGGAEAMGQRIQQLMGASGFEVAPEDRHLTAGKIQYWGVVSGVLPGLQQDDALSSTDRYPSADSFIDRVKTLAQQSQLSIYESEKFTARIDQSVKQVPVRIKMEGNKTNVLNFFGRLINFQGNYRISKLTVAPVSISDFKASKVKMVLDVWVAVT